MAETTDYPFKDFLATLRDEWERKTLLDFLRTEIDRQETESKRPGWTTWALCAAGAALISYLLSALEASRPELANCWRSLCSSVHRRRLLAFPGKRSPWNPGKSGVPASFPFDKCLHHGFTPLRCCHAYPPANCVWRLQVRAIWAASTLLQESRHVSWTQYLPRREHTYPFLSSPTYTKIDKKILVGSSHRGHSVGRYRHRGMYWHCAKTPKPVAFYSGLAGGNCFGGDIPGRALSLQASASTSPVGRSEGN
jgi:diadenosine tetraphosphatase ApaH/serine/threonine PP2A family protein phosphatase